MKIKQAYISSSLSYFKNGLLKKWGLVEYNNSNEPAFFLGLYNHKDMDVLRKHKTYKLLYFGGSDFTINKLKQIDLVKSTDKIICVGYGGEWIKNGCKKHNIPFSDERVLIRSFNDFKPSVLGDKIYVYKGFDGNKLSHYGWDDTIKPLIEEFGEDRFIYGSNVSLSELKNNYYEKSFIYIKPNESAGSTTMYELGFMGRKTITNGHDIFPNTLNYKTIYDIVEHIKNEEIKIGTTQINVSKELFDFCDNGDKWLDIGNYKW